MGTYQIPEIDSKRLTKLASKIRPTIRHENKLFYIKPPKDLAKTPFLWEPKMNGEASNLKPVITIMTLHQFGYYGLFKPSIAEVLAQMPVELENQAVAFEVSGPKTVDDLNKDIEALSAGYHVASTTFYAMESANG